VPVLTRPDGAVLFYELHGDPAATPLVLLEGMGGDIPGWRRNLPTLARHHLVVAYDFRGNGRSTAPAGAMSMETFARDTVALLGALGLPDAHLYGMSMGGMVALELALTRPTRVRSLVLAATHAGARRATRVDPPRTVPKDAPYLALYSERFARDHPDQVEEDVRVGRRQPQASGVRRRQREAVDGWDAWDRLGAVSCPTLVLHGTEDAVISVRNAERLAASIPGARLVRLEGAGHLYHAEQPQAADRAVVSFLEAVDEEVDEAR
jgi:pimeloyl-ACP methyl ester carboxylesterase